MNPTVPILRRKRGVSIRWSIFRTLLLIILIISGSLFVITAFTAGTSIRELSERLIGEAVGETSLRLLAFFEPVTDDLTVMRSLVRRGEFNPFDDQANRMLFTTLLERHKQITSIYWGSSTGESRLVAFLDGEWIAGYVSADRALPERISAFDPDTGKTLREESRERYDPTTRPWYKSAVAAGDGSVVWTPPYKFLTTGFIGVTGATAIRMPDGQELVLGMDVSLARILEFMGTLRPTPGGRAFLIADDGRILTAGHFGPVEEMTPEELGGKDVPVAALVAHAAKAEGLSIVRHGPEWWCGVMPLVTEGGQKFKIGVLIPQRDLVGERKEFRYVLLFVTLGALIAATALTLWVSRGYSDPIRRLVAHSERIERLDTDDVLDLKSSLRELDRLADAQEKMRRALASFARYVPINVVRDLLAQGAAAEIGGESREITVMFSDIAGFTTVAEGMTPDALTEQMGEYFDVVVTALLEHDATVDKFIGDAVMAFWGAPRTLENHAASAVRAVLTANERLAALNARWAAEGRAQLPTRFGIATGIATVGNVGAAFRLSYTALGDTVNLAQRLENLNNETKTWILANGATQAAAGGDFEWREIGATQVKGRRQYVSVFEVLGFAERVAPEEPEVAQA